MNAMTKDILNQLSDAVLLASNAEGILWVNSAFEHLFGWSEVEIRGADPKEYPASPGGLGEELEWMADVMREGGRIVNHVTRRLHRDGRGIDVSISWSLVKDTSDANDMMVGHFRDITEEQLKHRLLEESEQRYRSLFDHNPDAVFAIDREGRLISVNERSATNTGVPVDQLEGMSFEPFIHPEDLAKTRELVRDTLAGHGGELSFRLRKPCGEGYADMKASTLPIYVDGKIVGLYGVAKDVTETVRAQVELEESEQRFKSLFDHNPDFVFSFDTEGRVTSMNHRDHPDASDDWLGQSYLDFIVAEEHDKVMEEFRAVCAGEVRRFEVRAVNGATLDIINLPIYINGRITGVFGIAKDITALKQAQQDLTESEERHRKLVELSPDPIIVHRRCELLYWNRAAAECLGVDDEKVLMNAKVSDFVDPADMDRAREMEERVHRSGEASELQEFILKRYDGTSFHAEALGTKFDYNGSPATLVIIRDISIRKKSERLVEYMAYHDSLTGLPNRVRFHRMVSDKLGSDAMGAIFFIDLDRFKLINDTLGHRVGDHLLNEVSQRLKGFDEWTVSRQGGDEFTAYYPGADRETAERHAAWIIACLSKPYEINGHELYVTPSIGISMFPQDSTDVDILIQQADSALYQAKDFGGNSHIFFSAEVDEMNAFKLSLSNELRRGIAQEEMLLIYQPKYDLQERRIVGAEALIRWRHPKKGMISPEQFIPLAEETGMILPIGEWVLRKACEQTKAWIDAGHQLVISVNMSVRQFLQHNIVEQIKNILEESKLAPNFLNLEITESVPLLDLQTAIWKMNQIRELGVTISLDDFGTGYSSLNYIRLLPFDYLKIDKSFVRNIHKDSFNATIVQSVISIAQLMNKRVVAEGVESKEHLRLLEEAGCDEAQGYYLSKPIDASEFEGLLAGR